MHTLRLHVPPDTVNAVHDLLENVWADEPDVSLIDRISFETAVIELASNIIRHAEADTDAGITCILRLEISADRIQATLRDTGTAGLVGLPSVDMPDESAESGRGIPLIQALVHELDYNRDGNMNEWHITRRRE
nr:ATP-binding protein [Cryobacterium roopkundense]